MTARRDLADALDQLDALEEDLRRARCTPSCAGALVDAEYCACRCGGRHHGALWEHLDGLFVALGTARLDRPNLKVVGS